MHHSDGKGEDGKGEDGKGEDGKGEDGKGEDGKTKLPVKEPQQCGLSHCPFLV